MAARPKLYVGTKDESNLVPRGTASVPGPDRRRAARAGGDRALRHQAVSSLHPRRQGLLPPRRLGAGCDPERSLDRAAKSRRRCRLEAAAVHLAGRPRDMARRPHQSDHHDAARRPRHRGHCRHDLAIWRRGIWQEGGAARRVRLPGLLCRGEPDRAGQT